MAQPNPTGVVLTFPVQAYTPKAVINAATDFLSKAWVKIEEVSSENILVRLIPKNPESFPSDLLSRDFENQVLDHQIRVNLQGETKIIREMIVAQAFDPCDNLEEILEIYGM
jgi:His-Xaa-Ser system protein HxsD